MFPLYKKDRESEKETESIVLSIYTVVGVSFSQRITVPRTGHYIGRCVCPLWTGSSITGHPWPHDPWLRSTTRRTRKTKFLIDKESRSLKHKKTVSMTEFLFNKVKGFPLFSFFCSLCILHETLLKRKTFNSLPFFSQTGKDCYYWSYVYSPCRCIMKSNIYECY